jgi:hypothetical protein
VSDDDDLNEFLDLVGQEDRAASPSGAESDPCWICNVHLLTDDGDDEGEHCLTVLTTEAAGIGNCATCRGSPAICTCPAGKGICEGASCPRVQATKAAVKQVGLRSRVGDPKL